jgi:hypothetical protein
MYITAVEVVVDPLDEKLVSTKKIRTILGICISPVLEPDDHIYGEQMQQKSSSWTVYYMMIDEPH